MSSEDAYIEHQKRMEALLPARFINRMATDTWYFGLLLVTGQVLAIDNIADVRQDANGNLWIDATMLEDTPTLYKPNAWPVILAAPTERVDVSINVRHIVCAVELADT
jgi:hypothetical protein